MNGLFWLALLASLGLVGTVLQLLRVRRQLQTLQHGQQRLHAIFDNPLFGMARCDRQRRLIEVNPTLCKMLGYSADELVGHQWTEFTHPDDLHICSEHFASVVNGQQDSYTLERRFIRKDGRNINVQLGVQVIRNADGEFDYLNAIYEDITQRRRAQAHYRSQVERAKVLIELPRYAETMQESELLQFMLDRVEALTGSEISFVHLLAADQNTLIYSTWSKRTQQLCPAGDSHAPIADAGLWADAVRRRQPVIINDYPQPASHERLPAEHVPLRRMIGVPVIEKGLVPMIIGAGNKSDNYSDYDIETLQLLVNETWRLLQRQRNQHELLLTGQLINASPVVCFRCAAGAGWPILFVSENVSQWGYSASELLSGQCSFTNLLHPDDQTQIDAEVSAHLAVGATKYEQEYRVLTREKQALWVVDRTTVVYDDNGQPQYFDCILTDISERKAQQQLLNDNLAQQQKLNKRLEEANSQLLQSEKMASIGQLAAGIAHELNNPIGFVHSNLGTLDGYLHDLMAIIDAYASAIQAAGDSFPHSRALAQLREERDFDFLRDDIFKLLSESKEGLGRVRKIVLDLKTFSRVGETEWQAADLHQGIDSTLNIVWNELKYKCQIVKEYGDIPPVYCLISQLNQVFMNLLVNAGHAIDGKGTIHIRTGRSGDDQVFIEISDSGKGIPPENQTRIFEPFFTTKPVGKGTGLGLSVSYNIVQRHHGDITFTSKAGVGTTFRITLPIHPAPQAAEEIQA